MIHGLLFNVFLDLALIALPISILISRERNLKKAVKKIGFEHIAPKKLLVKTTKLFLILIALSIWLSVLLMFLGINDLEMVTESIQETRTIFPIFIWLVVLRVISEEIFFRGFLVNELGVIGSSAIFALFHIGYGSIAEMIGVFVLGLVLAKAFELNKNLYPNILAHLAYNLIVISII